MTLPELGSLTKVVRRHTGRISFWKEGGAEESLAFLYEVTRARRLCGGPLPGVLLYSTTIVVFNSYYSSARHC